MEEKKFQSESTEGTRKIDEKGEYTALAVSLNNKFRKGETCFDVLDDIRKFPRPICVGFNNVLANNSDPLKANPDSKKFLDELNQVGNVFIVTTAESHEGVQEFMEKNGMWSDDFVLMAKPSWYFVTSHAEQMYGVPRVKAAEKFSKREKELKTKANKSVQEYIELMAKEGIDFNVADFSDVPARKTIAPIFGKNWPVLIIDDSGMATRSNPNMYGVHVQIWEPDPEDYIMDINEGKPTILDAVEITKQHFQKLESEGKI